MRRWAWRSRKQKEQSSVLKVGVMGATGGVGTTHLALMLANYYARGCNRKTVVIEYGEHRDFVRICRFTGADAGDIKHFFYEGIEFAVCRTASQVADYVSKDYEVVILDMASDNKEALEELKRCDIRLIAGATSMWKIEGLRKLLSKMQGVRCSLAVFLGEPKSMRKLAAEYKVGLLKVPIENNPLVISSKTMYVIKDFLANNKY